MIGLSTVALVLEFSLPPAVRHAAWVSLVAIAGGFVGIGAAALAAAGPRHAGVVARRFPAAHGCRTASASCMRSKSRFTRSRCGVGSVLAPLVAAEAMFHVLGVMEVHLTWWLIQGAPPALMTAFIFEGANRLVQVLFKFVPLQDRRRRAHDRQLHRDAGIWRRARHDAWRSCGRSARSPGCSSARRC